ncbi:MAG: DMT family transporter [Rhodospirillaceae bacterium]|nr:DMT family transporter [Rhodospirillaceae bacterium]MBT5943627.1 DMT family transporter [Rhodospirillaceae bacterium]MBT6404852.1 DMT family transporter [Rhodospirillaceae bacterium]MBT6534681.1 DMT family transporter [Rhodospirillaceae bacterium]MBT7360471.1 DMT family transporter [Rhodospirillaceae bacterium]
MTAPHISPSTSRRPDNVVGILWMVAATFIAVSTHAMIRHVAEGGMHAFEVAFFYNLFTMLIIVPMIARSGTGFLRTRRHGLMFVRAVLHLTSMLLFYVGLTLAPLAAASALTFLAPLFAVLLAAIFLREGFPLRRVIALFVGFTGMLIIVQPGPSALDTGALYFVGAASLWGAVLLIIKIMSRTESSATITAWMAIMMAPMALLPAIPYWTPPSLTDIGWLAAAGFLGAFAQWALTQALRTGSTNAVMPIDFLRLVWGALIGFAIFTEVPDVYTWVGGIVIFGSSMWLAWRERAAMQIENKTRIES